MSKFETRPVKIVRHRPYPEGEGPPEARFARLPEGFMLLDENDSAPTSRICETLAIFELDHATQVEHSRIAFESLDHVVDLINQELVDGLSPHKYVSSASPYDLFGILNIANTAAGRAMGIRSFKRIDPPAMIKVAATVDSSHGCGG